MLRSSHCSAPKLLLYAPLHSTPFWIEAVSCCSRGIELGAVRERNSILLLHGSGSRVERSGAVFCCSMEVTERIYCRNTTAPPRSQIYSAGAARYYSTSKLLCCAPLAPTTMEQQDTAPLQKCFSPLHSHRAAIYCSAPELLRSNLLPLNIPGINIT